MSNPARSRRRRRAIAASLRCPDCNSIARVGAARRDPALDLRAEVLHDPTCPWLLAHGGRVTVVRLIGRDSL